MDFCITYVHVYLKRIFDYIEHFKNNIRFFFVLCSLSLFFVSLAYCYILNWLCIYAATLLLLNLQKSIRTHYMAMEREHKFDFSFCSLINNFVDAIEAHSSWTSFFVEAPTFDFLNAQNNLINQGITKQNKTKNRRKKLARKYEMFLLQIWILIIFSFHFDFSLPYLYLSQFFAQKLHTQNQK